MCIAKNGDASCALARLLQPQNLSAKVVSDCVNEVASGTTVTPLVAQIGETITINLVNAGTKKERGDPYV
jgi:hypothetical protein